MNLVAFMPSYAKKLNILCYTKNELYQLFKADLGPRLMSILESKEPLVKSICSLSQKLAEDRDRHEIAVALFSFLDFYDNPRWVCFEMKKGFDPIKNRVVTLKDLNNYRGIDSDSDFVIRTKNNFRYFQLKRYRGKLDGKNLFNFIKKKIAHYCNNLGDNNLLIIPQSPGVVFNLDFKKLHQNIRNLGFKFRGQIMLNWNQLNSENVVVILYPKLKKTVRPFVLPSAKF